VEPIDVPGLHDRNVTLMSAVSPNPTTDRIAYSVRVPGPTRVRVHVYDIAGRLVETLVDDELPAGSHPLSWDAAANGERISGVYYLRANAGGLTQTRKIIIIR